MKIREFKESDAEAVAKLSNENADFFQFSGVTSEFLKRLCSHPKYRLFVLEDNKEIIGFGGINYQNLQMAELGPICVRADCRRQGLGRLLVDATFEFMRRMKGPKVIIKVKASNIAAQEFFTSLGFRKSQEILVLEEPALLMEIGLERP